jgi:hypothetical protein
MRIKWNEETWYSRLATLVFFLLGLTSVSFFVGREYESTIGFITKEIQAQSNIEENSLEIIRSVSESNAQVDVDL